MNLQVIELKNQRILTTEQLAEFYGATQKNIQDNFSNNKNKFSEGKHYFLLKGEELKEFKNYTEDIGLVDKRAPQLIIWTKQGASRHSKMLGTEKAWDMFDELEENYFNPIKQQSNKNLTYREQAMLALAANEETNERVDAVEKEVKDIKDNQKIAADDYSYISRRVSQRVSEVAKGFGELTNEQRGRLFKDINTGIKQVTGVGSRSQIREKHYEIVVEFIQDWEPSTATKTIVRQMSLDLDDIL